MKPPTIGKYSSVVTRSFVHICGSVSSIIFIFIVSNKDLEDNSDTATVLQFWTKRREKLINDYSLVGYILSPHPTIMEDAAKNKTQEHFDAALRLITKLLIDPKLIGQAKLTAIATAYDTFLSEWDDFSNRKGKLISDHIWIIAAVDDTQAYDWHKKYSLLSTKVLGKLACLVTSKILGIGTAERNWKQVKNVKSGQRVNTSIDKTKKQVLIHAMHGEQRAQVKRSKLSAAGKLWSDEDFKSMKMDVFCKEIKDSLNEGEDEDDGGSRLLRLWRERWEKKKVTSQSSSSNNILEGRLIRKYCGLRYYDVSTFGMDTEWVLKIHPSKVKFVPKLRGPGHFMLYVANDIETINTYDDEDENDVNGNNGKWKEVDLDADLFVGLRKYYNENRGSVICYEKNGECCSDHEDDV